MGAANLDGGAGQAPNAISRKTRTRGGIVTIVTVLALLAAMSLTWFGLSINDQVSANYDASSWLWSMVKGEVARVNGLTGKVDTRTDVPTSRGHMVQISQSDRFLVMRDVNTGKISTLDPATLGIVATVDSQQGKGVTVALDGDSAFIVDPVQGVVRQLDPATLQPIGEPLNYPPGITGGSFDGQGRLWIAVPSQGTVSAIVPADLSAPGGGTGAAGGPSMVRTESVADAAHDLMLSALDDGVAVLDQTNGVLTTIRGDQVRQVTVSAAAGGRLPARTQGDSVPITVPDSRKLLVVTDDKVEEFTVPGDGGKLAPAVSWAGRFYVADDADGRVYVIEGDGQVDKPIPFAKPNGSLELEVRENHLFINAPGSADARVVDDRHRVKDVDKFADDILGGDPPAAMPPPPPPKPQVGPPGAPRSVVASAGDGQVRLSWTAAKDNGSAITRYVIEGGPKKLTAGTRQRTITIEGLTNGQKYTFTVSAVNAKGIGPGRRSNTVMPTGDVPDAPTEVGAVANPDGTVTVKWKAANGQGRKIRKYEVTAISDGGSTLVGTSKSTSLTVKDKVLEYGTGYAFTVVAVNDINAGSEPSAPSPTVTPFTKPSKVGGLSATTVATSKGAIKVVWSAAADNGRPIIGYDVTAKDTTKRVTGTGVTLNGFGDGEIVTVTVAAVNEAGTGPGATTSAKTIAAPTVSAPTTKSVSYNSMKVYFSYTDGGGSASCVLTVNGSPRTIACSSGAGGYTVTGLWPNQVYKWTVKVTNAAGSAVSAPQSPKTPVLYGWVRCVNTSAYGDPSYCNGGISTYSITSQHSSNWVRTRPNSSSKKIAAICKKAGMNPPKAGSDNSSATIKAAAYNGSKSSSWWVKIGSSEYIPFAWFNLESYGHAGADNVGKLPTC